MIKTRVAIKSLGLYAYGEDKEHALIRIAEAFELLYRTAGPLNMVKRLERMGAVEVTEEEVKGD